MSKYKNSIMQYIQGWEEANREKILAVLTDDVVVIESHGPVYKGKELVAKWIDDWHRESGKVLAWKITSYSEQEDTIFFEWEFDYTYRNKQDHISGITITKIMKDKISFLREYRTTEALFDYQ